MSTTSYTYDTKGRQGGPAMNRSFDLDGRLVHASNVDISYNQRNLVQPGRLGC